MKIEEITNLLKPSILFKSMTKIVHLINSYANFKHELNDELRRIVMPDKSRTQVMDLFSRYEEFLKNEIVNFIKGDHNEKKEK